MSEPLLTVILCVYNDAAYLRRSLQSILGQALGPDQLILVDDASTDGSLDIAREFAARHPCVEIVRNSRNLGALASGAAALDRAKGAYVAWWSADDVVFDGIFAWAREAARNCPEAGVLATETEVADEHGRDMYSHTFALERAHAFLSPGDFAAANRRRYVWIASSGAFLRRDALLGTGGWRSELDWFADWFAAYAVALRHGVVLIGRVGSRVSKRPDSYGAQARGDPRRRNAAIRAFFDLLRQERHRDLRRGFEAGPLMLSYALGSSLFGALSRRPEDWNMLVSVVACWLAHRLRVAWSKSVPSVPSLLGRKV